MKASATVKLDDFRGLIKFAAFAGHRFIGGIVFYAGQDILSFAQGSIQLYALPIGLYF